MYQIEQVIKDAFIFVAPVLARRCDIGVLWPVRSSIRPFVHSSTIDLWAQLLLQFLANRFETSQMFWP